MSEQLFFDLFEAKPFSASGFLRAECNRDAFAQVTTIRWPALHGVLAGPEGSGKTHLAHIWADAQGAQVYSIEDSLSFSEQSIIKHGIVIDNMDRLKGRRDLQAALFHLHNAALRHEQPILFVGRGTLSGWKIELPDLQTRLSALAPFYLYRPDDVLLMQVLGSLFVERGLFPPASVVQYIVTRMPRSLTRAHEIVAYLDTVSLTQKKPLTVPFAAKLLKSWFNTPHSTP